MGKVGRRRDARKMVAEDFRGKESVQRNTRGGCGPTSVIKKMGVGKNKKGVGRQVKRADASVSCDIKWVW